MTLPSPKQPTQITNKSKPLLSNDAFNDLFKNVSTSSNSSSEKMFRFDLNDFAPSTWNVSLKSNDSVLLDVILPSSNISSNLTFTDIELNRLSTNIIGTPVNVYVDRVNTKQFSLKMNATNNNPKSNNTKPSSSDIIIGHVKSEQFELSLVKTDNMHVRVQQVDSTTAELFLDSNFCTNESSLEINLNLSKNGRH